MKIWSTSMLSRTCCTHLFCPLNSLSQSKIIASSSSTHSRQSRPSPIPTSTTYPPHPACSHLRRSFGVGGAAAATASQRRHESYIAGCEQQRYNVLFKVTANIAVIAFVVRVVRVVAVARVAARSGADTRPVHPAGAHRRAVRAVEEAADVDGHDDDDDGDKAEEGESCRAAA